MPTLDEHSKVFPEVDESRALVGELEPDALHVSRVLAAAVLVSVDDDLLNRGGLVSVERGEVDNDVALGGRLDIVEHVRKADLGEFGENVLFRYRELLDRPLGRLGLDRVHLSLKLGDTF